MNPKKYADKELINLLKTANTRDIGLQYIYEQKEWRNSVVAMIRKNGNDTSLLNDLYTQALITCERNIREGKFKEESSLKTYFVSICKYLLFTKNRKEMKVEYKANPREDRSSQEGNPELSLLSDEKRDLIYKVLKQLGEPCATVLRMWAEGFKSADIAKAANIEEVDNTKRITYRCREKMKKIVRGNSNLLNDLKEHYG